MNLVGKKVVHAVKYGNGVITAVNGDHVNVKFAGGKSAVFVYPDCFVSNLKLEDSVAAEEVKAVIDKKTQLSAKFQAATTHSFGGATNTYSGSNSWKPTTVSHSTLPTVSSSGSVDEFCAVYGGAVTAEVMYLKASGGKRIRLFDGEQIRFKDNKYTYSFESDMELFYPDGTQISIWQGLSSVLGTVVNCEEFTVLIESSADLGKEIPLLEISVESWRLLNTLNDRLNTIRDNPSEIVRALICDGRKAIDYSGKIARGQDTACAMAGSQPITFIWGPPGTGKTETLSKIALEQMALGNRVLMLSYSNVSVDGAAARVFKNDTQHKPGRVVRYGYARDEKLLQHEYLTAYNLALHRHPQLVSERAALVAERKKQPHNSSRYVEIVKRLSAIAQLLKDEEKNSVINAQFVATTVSKAVVDKAVYEHDFDVVIFDEASMAYIPQVVFSASLCTKHFICMGDFSQLPPIVQENAESKLNSDIFQYCGVTEAVGKHYGHKWLCLLNVQYRMHPFIADFASKTMYSDLLSSEKTLFDKRNQIADEEYPASGAISFADLSFMMSVCTTTGDNSRVNVLSAFVAFAMATNAAAKYDVAIITPYNAQSRLLHAMAHDLVLQAPDYHPVSCATVHQFQGSEKDIVFYDAVDCFRQKYPGVLLTSNKNNYANRLFNVALTRSKGKFVGVANINYMDNKNLSPKLMFGQLMYKQRYAKSCQAGNKLIDALEKKMPCIEFVRSKDSFSLFVADMKLAKKEIRIDIPGTVNVSEEDLLDITKILAEAKSRGVKVYVRAESKAALPAQLRVFAIENPYVANPITMIDRKVTWFGEPLSAANFISENKTIVTKFRPIIRFEGRYTATSIYGFMEMSHTVDQKHSAVSEDEPTDTFASYVATTMKCKSCGKPMKLRKSKKGKYFLGCTGYPDCSAKEYVDVDVVNKYLYRNGGTGQHCPQDHTSLEAKVGPYGMYVCCCGVHKHIFHLDEI